MLAATDIKKERKRVTQRFEKKSPEKNKIHTEEVEIAIENIKKYTLRPKS